MTWIARGLAASLAFTLGVSGPSAPATGGTAESTSIEGYIGFLGNETSHTITRPGSTAVSATFHAPSGNTDGIPLELWARSYGGSWHLVETLQSDGAGKVSRTVSPVHNTLYEWHFAGNAQQSASESQLLTVRVRCLVTLGVDDSSPRVGQRMTARGVVRPLKPGVQVTLWRAYFDERVKLASGTIRSDGSFRIYHVFRKRGPKYLFVTVPASTGNLGGKSSTRTVTVG
jgi:hypothetical protein